MKRALTTLFLAALLTAAGCGGPAVLSDGTSTLQGEVVFDDDHGGPAPDVVEVLLVDTADPDSRIGPLGRERVDDPGNPPVPFTLVYNVRSVQSGHAYGLCARALDASGDTIWQSRRAAPVQVPSDEQWRVPVTRDRDDWVDCGWQD